MAATISRRSTRTVDSWANVGYESPQPPKEAYEPIWCAWGYERDCTVQLIEDTLPKVKELGLSWAVIDDGWQSTVGDWNPNPESFRAARPICSSWCRDPRQGLKPRLWIAPLAAAPGCDLLHDHTDMLLLDQDGRRSVRLLVEQLLPVSRVRADRAYTRAGRRFSATGASRA